jgi:hypothetical protein
MLNSRRNVLVVINKPLGLIFKLTAKIVSPCFVGELVIEGIAMKTN